MQDLPGPFLIGLTHHVTQSSANKIASGMRFKALSWLCISNVLLRHDLQTQNMLLRKITRKLKKSMVPGMQVHQHGMLMF